MITVVRTGNAYSIAASEFLVTFPDGTTQTIWSPPWNDYTPEQEQTKAEEYAAELWAARNAKRQVVQARRNYFGAPHTEFK